MFIFLRVGEGNEGGRGEAEGDEEGLGWKWVFRGFFLSNGGEEPRSLFSHVSGSEGKGVGGLGRGFGTGTAELYGGRGAWAVAHLSRCLWAGWVS